MSKNFSKQFESTFRVVFIIWVSFWGVINILGVLFSYLRLAFAADDQAEDIVSLIINTVGDIGAIACGITLLLLMLGAAKAIKDQKPVETLGLMSGLVPVYYFLETLTDFISVVFLSSEGIGLYMLRIFMWLIPSIALCIFHYMYIRNLRQYNARIPKTVPAA